MMQSAFPERASSRYMLSLGSRHFLTVCSIGIILTIACRCKINSNLVSRRKYLSNFEWINTLLNSLKVFMEARIPCFFPFSQHRRGVLPLRMKALTRTLQSKMTFSYLRSSSISLKIFSRISGVRPFFSAWRLVSSMISSKLLLLEMSRSKVLEMAFFSSGDIRSIFSAAWSLTSSVIVFILQI